MIQSGTARNVGIFLVIFILILGISLDGLNFGFTLVSFAQETGETGEIVETEDTRETPATQESIEVEETEKTEEEAATEEEEELDISLTAEYITYEKKDEEDLIVAKDGVF
jgi:hypothetical protein